jgi:hypothetical protein
MNNNKSDDNCQNKKSPIDMICDAINKLKEEASKLPDGEREALLKGMAEAIFDAQAGKCWMLTPRGIKKFDTKTGAREIPRGFIK